MKNNNILQLNMVHDNYDNLNGNCQLAMGDLDVVDRTTNKTQTINAIMVKFEDLGYFQLMCINAMHNYIKNNYVYNFGIVMNEQEKMFFLCDHKYHITPKDFKKIYKDLTKNLDRIVEAPCDLCAFIFATKPKQEIKKLFEELIEVFRTPSINVKGER